MAVIHQFLIRCFLVTALALISVMAGSANAAELGSKIVNIGTVAWSNGGHPTEITTNEATITIKAQRTESEIEFFRYAPSLPGTMQDMVRGSDYAPSGTVEGGFVPIGPAVNPGNQVIDLSTSIPLSPAAAYMTGEVMFVRVTDRGQNGSPNRIEHVVVTIEATTGDKVTLRLYESGPDTGEFWAYIPSSRAVTPINDTRLTTAKSARLTATYIDSFDATEVSVDTALVDPFGRVFNTMTGELLDGIPVTLMNMATGQPADVYGIDGVSRYPSTITTGSQIIDAAGLVYEMQDGEFRFPLIAAGEYQLHIDTPQGLLISSMTTPSEFDSIAGAPFTIVAASFGSSFTLDGLGSVGFDVPLDPASDLAVTKSVEASTADIGDYVRYTVGVDNLGSNAVPVILRDIAPKGFRYVAGSSRIGPTEREQSAVSDPQISDDGRSFDYSLGVLQPGEAASISYVMQIGAGAELGDSYNAAMAVDRGGRPLSNTARAVVTIREDLFRTKTTIIGRVADQACEADDDWAREITDGVGIEGVRLYLETGDYAVTDEDGLYHFEGVAEGTHVVQLDKETLPQGYEPMICEENSRYAGRATSKFVDVKGGNIWRANFYLKRTGALATTDAAEVFNDQTEYRKFDRDWLASEDGKIEWVYPNPARTPSLTSTNIGIKHPPGHGIRLTLNGRPVAGENFEKRDTNLDRTAVLSRWRGVDLNHGRNTFTAQVMTRDGTVVETLTRDIWFVTEATRAIPVVDQSLLVADGRTAPVLAVRMEDNAGRPVHAGRLLTVDIAAPYRLEEKRKLEDTNELVAPLAAQAHIAVGADGIARIRLEPTLQTGRVNLLVNLDDGRQVPIEMYLKPEKRDWIIVGLAEGTVGYETLRSNGSGTDSDDVFTDGRVAFFAKGLVKGEWLLTLQVDTDKSRANRDDDFDEEIDPNAYYTLYGDRTYQELETPSRYPLYVKLEKNQFYAMFGDYDTNMIDSKLTRYTRRLSGVKTEYVGEQFRVVAFGAESNQGFAQEEIPADGTSGSYRLGDAPILIDSETVEIETRDRFRPDIVIERTRLVRHLDYTLDYLTGELIFRLPIPVSDSDLNPNVIVVDYETELDAERNFTYGARVSGDFLGDRVTVGGAYVSEGGDRSAADSRKQVAGVDIVARPVDGVEARVEIARSDNDLDGEEAQATAWLAEITYRTAQLAAELYVREEEEGFGLGQQTSSTAGARRWGAITTYEFGRSVNPETGVITTRKGTLNAYHEERLDDGSTRVLADATVSQDTDRYGVSVGMRYVEDEVEGVDKAQSTLATVSGRLSIPEWRATVTARHEQPLINDDDVNEFPQRTTLGVSKVVNRWATVNVTHEYRNGDQLDSHITTAGVTLNPWTGGSVTFGSDMQTQDSARRIGATVGLDQRIRLNDHWTATVGFANHNVLTENAPLAQLLPDVANSPLELNEDYTAGYAGVGYRSETTAGSIRFETRLTDGEDRHTLASSVTREISETFSVAGSSRLQLTQPETLAADETDIINGDLKLGMAWRPRVEGPVILNRLDLKYDREQTGEQTTKVINNFAANTNLGDRTQVTGHYGVKYVHQEFGGTKYDGWTHLLGAEARFDVTRRIDLGIHGSILYIPDAGTKQYAWGPSIGVSPVDNMWISLGYNFEGFDDDDFEAARYSRHGLYLKLRLKFDEDTARNILDMISP